MKHLKGSKLGGMLSLALFLEARNLALILYFLPGRKTTERCKIHEFWFHVSENYTPIPYHLWHINPLIFHKNQPLRHVQVPIPVPWILCVPSLEITCPKAILKDDFPFPQLGKVSSLWFVLSATFLLTFLCRKIWGKVPNFWLSTTARFGRIFYRASWILSFVRWFFWTDFSPMGLNNKTGNRCYWSDQIIATSHEFSPQMVAFVREIPKHFREIWVTGEILFQSDQKLIQGVDGHSTSF